ncbi:hypothetical protein MTO96_040637 [Rhipicephalus appendiculatus]
MLNDAIHSDNAFRILEWQRTFYFHNSRVLLPVRAYQAGLCRGKLQFGSVDTSGHYEAIWAPCTASIRYYSLPYSTAIFTLRTGLVHLSVELCSRKPEAPCRSDKEHLVSFASIVTDSDMHNSEDVAKLVLALPNC